MMVPASDRHVLSRVGFVLEALGRIGLVAWAGLAAGWLVLSVTWPSGGWFWVLVITYGLVVALPSSAAVLAGRYLYLRRAWRAPAISRLVRWSIVTASFLAAAMFAYLEGWPR